MNDKKEVKKGIKIAREVAQLEFDRFVDLMSINIDVDRMDDVDKANTKTDMETFIKATMGGFLVVNDEGEPIYTCQRTNGNDVEPFVFSEPTGAALMAMDRRKQTEDVGKLFASMAEITGRPANLFSKMKMSDLKVCMAIVGLFLA